MATNEYKTCETIENRAQLQNGQNQLHYSLVLRLFALSTFVTVEDCAIYVL